ncbi:MAG: phosphoribosylanthranilate isomerase [Candidatus Omnitrophica bacterium]|nr:phosphoribosylanthranilate isomerase [Candidatus Omnitrophota bacterium]
MVKVKICGITNLEDALLASSLGADALGFIFSKKSPRYISESAAKKIITRLDPFLTKVGVFLDQEPKAVFDIATKLNLDVLQFHGSESASYCRFFAKKFKLVKVFFPQNSADLKKISGYKVDANMFDVKYEQKKSGVNFLSESILAGISKLIKRGEPVIISGGLNVNNVIKIKKLKPYAIDVASGIEKLVGKKDEQLIKEFIEKVKR